MLETLANEIMRLEVRVRPARLKNNKRGLYCHDRNLILINRGLTAAQYTETLAHELAHAHYGHDCDSEKAERQAWRRAALLTVDPIAYALAELQNPHLNFIAAELDLTPNLIRQWRTNWGDTCRADYTRTQAFIEYEGTA